MASAISMIQAGFSCGGALSSFTARPRRMVVVRAEAINPDIKKDEAKVVDSVVVTELSKPLTAYCRFFFLFLFSLRIYTIIVLYSCAP